MDDEEFAKQYAKAKTQDPDQYWFERACRREQSGDLDE